MSYRYEVEKPSLFTDSGQRAFLQVRDNVFRLLKLAGAVRMGEAWGSVSIGSNWFGLACLDRMIELGELREVSEAGCTGQHRIFVKAGYEH